MAPLAVGTVFGGQDSGVEPADTAKGFGKNLGVIIGEIPWPGTSGYVTYVSRMETETIESRGGFG
jgi:hypothetical protein